MRVVTHGATDQSVEIYIVDADGLPATGLAYNSSGIDLWYRRNGAAVTSITEATQTANGAHSDGGFVGLGNGVYRLDPPDAAFASGVSHVTFGGTLTGYTVYPVTVQLSAFDLQTATQAVNVTQISGDSTAADNAESFFDGTGYAGTGNVIPTVTTTTNLTNKGDGSGFTAIPWNASWDAEVQSECTDALNAYDPPTNTEMVARTLAQGEYATLERQDDIDAFLADIPTVAEFNARTVASATYATASALSTVDGILDNIFTGMELDGSVYRWTTNALEQGPSGGGGGGSPWDALVADYDTTGTFGALVMKNTDTIVIDQDGLDDIRDAMRQARINQPPDPGFTTQVSRRNDGTYKCTKPIRITSGAITQVFAFIDMSPLFGANNLVETVGTPTVSGGSVTASAEGPRDTYAVVELDGTATAGEERTVTVPVTMSSGTQVDVVFDLEVFD
jgi:hypothetical protein